VIDAIQSGVQQIKEFIEWIKVSRCECEGSRLRSRGYNSSGSFIAPRCSF